MSAGELQGISRSVALRAPEQHEPRDATDQEQERRWLRYEVQAQYPEARNDCLRRDVRADEDGSD